MFDKFFEKHKPDNEAVPLAESVGRIEALLKGKLNETTFKEEKPMKKSIVKRILLIAAAAAAAASALIFSATADYEGNEKYIVRINGKRVDADIVSYKEGRIELDVITYEMPCEMLITYDGKPVTEDSDIDRRVGDYIIHVYASEDPDEQVWDPVKGVAMLSGGSGGFGMYGADAMTITVPNGSSGTNTLDHPTYLEYHYDEKEAKEFWENYWKNPDEEARKWAEHWAFLTPDEDLTMVELLKKRISEHLEINQSSFDEFSTEYITETEKNKILEFLDQNFGE